MQQANPRLLAAPPPFSVPLDPQSPVPLYLQLRDALRGLMASGTLAAGQRLAPTRDLARQLGINRTTVSAAYAELEAEGWLAGHVGRGTFVTGPAAAKPKPRPPSAIREPFSWSRFFPEVRNEDSEEALMRTLEQVECLCKREDANQVIGELLQKFDAVTNLSAWTDQQHLH